MNPKCRIDLFWNQIFVYSLCAKFFDNDNIEQFLYTFNIIVSSCVPSAPFIIKLFTFHYEQTIVIV